MQYRAIAIDCDDVLVETAPLIIRDYNKRYGTQLDLGDMYSSDLSRWEVADRKMAIDRVEAYLQTEEYRQAPPLQESIDAIERLSSVYTLHLVTGRSDMLEQATRDFLDAHFNGLFRSLTFTNLFNSQQQTKSEICKKLGADLLIDDHLGHALPVAEAGVDVMLFGDYPWNQAPTLPPNVRRVKDWPEVARLLLPD